MEKIINEYRSRIIQYLQQPKELAELLNTKEALDTIRGFLLASGAITQKQDAEIIKEAREQAGCN